MRWRFDSALLPRNAKRASGVTWVNSSSLGRRNSDADCANACCELSNIGFLIAKVREKSAVPSPRLMDALRRSHAALRAALILARREIRKLNFGRKDAPLLVKLDARRVAKTTDSPN
jgi:hypothetical protein